MKILVTGGTGFIGCYFADALTELGHELVVIDLHPFPTDDYEKHPKIEFIQGDIRDSELMRSAIADCNAVLHLAAAHHDFGISEETFHDVNVNGARIICEEMTRAGITNICFYSTVAIYGEAAPPVDENTDPNPVSPYGKTKLAGEKVFEQWVAENENNQCLVIRPTVTYGPGNFANMFTLIRQIDKGLFLPVGKGENIKSLSYVENIVEATNQIWLSDQPLESRFAAYNYVCKPDLSSAEIADTIYQALKKKSPKFNVPYAIARVLALPFDIVIKLTGMNLPVSGARIKKLARAMTKYESEKIRNAGFEQHISIRDGIERMVRWYLDQGKQLAESGLLNRRPPEKTG